MKKVYDLAVKVGSYQKGSETKNRYQNVGSVMEGDNGQFIIMDRTFNPAGVPNPDVKSSVIISMFTPKADGSSLMGEEVKSGSVGSFASKTPADTSEDIPF